MPQRQRRHAAEQVRGDRERLEQPGYGPHAEQALEDHQSEQHFRQHARHAGAEAQQREPRNHQAERRGQIAVGHFLPRLGVLDRPLGKALLRLLDVRGLGRHRQLPVAARPVRAAEAGVGQAHVGAEHDDREAQQQRGRVQPPEQDHGENDGRSWLYFSRPARCAAAS
jgi:hypothetical protein